MPVMRVPNTRSGSQFEGTLTPLKGTIQYQSQSSSQELSKPMNIVAEVPDSHDWITYSVFGNLIQLTLSC